MSYIAFAFAWFESLIGNKDAYETALAMLKSTPELLERAGFQKLAFEDFYDVTLEQFEQLPQRVNDRDMLLVNFQSEEISNAIVMHLRFVASAYLRIHFAEYEPFLVAEMISIDEFCAMHVEAFGRESDHLQIIALSKALDVPVQIVYLDGSADETPAVHDFWPDENDKEGKKPFRLIYRPGITFSCHTCSFFLLLIRIIGHYDILYEKR